MRHAFARSPQYGHFAIAVTLPDLRQGRSIEAEQAIEAAEAFMRGALDALPAELRSQSAIQHALAANLAAHDDFWARWLTETDQLPRPKRKR